MCSVRWCTRNPPRWARDGLHPAAGREANPTAERPDTEKERQGSSPCSRCPPWFSSSFLCRLPRPGAGASGVSTCDPPNGGWRPMPACQRWQPSATQKSPPGIALLAARRSRGCANTCTRTRGSERRSHRAQTVPGVCGARGGSSPIAAPIVSGRQRPGSPREARGLNKRERDAISFPPGCVPSARLRFPAHLPSAGPGCPTGRRLWPDRPAALRSLFPQADYLTLHLTGCRLSCQGKNDGNSRPNP